MLAAHYDCKNTDTFRIASRKRARLAKPGDLRQVRVLQKLRGEHNIKILGTEGIDIAKRRTFTREGLNRGAGRAENVPFLFLIGHRRGFILGRARPANRTRLARLAGESAQRRPLTRAR